MRANTAQPRSLKDVLRDRYTMCAHFDKKRGHVWRPAHEPELAKQGYYRCCTCDCGSGGCGLYGKRATPETPLEEIEVVFCDKPGCDDVVFGGEVMGDGVAVFLCNSHHFFLVAHLFDDFVGH